MLIPYLKEKEIETGINKEIGRSWNINILQARGKDRGGRLRSGPFRWVVRLLRSFCLGKVITGSGTLL